LLRSPSAIPKVLNAVSTAGSAATIWAIESAKKKMILLTLLMF
jgi:hypothetical protein